MTDADTSKSPFRRTQSNAEETGLSKPWKLYRLRWKRRRFLFRSLRKRSDLVSIENRTSAIGQNDILLFMVVRNEAERLPYVLKYYRQLGVSHFLIVDNDSTDRTSDILTGQDDVSLWSTTKSYRLSRFGVDWLTVLQIRYGHGHWCLTVDADELLVYPRCEHLGLTDLISQLERNGQDALGAVILDMFPKGQISDAKTRVGDDPLKTLPWFDAGPYRTQIHKTYGNEWIQGGVRDRVFFSDDPDRAPTLNKFPLVKWNRRFAYVNSTHQILPGSLHKFLDVDSRKYVSGALLHTKFLPSIMEKSQEELDRKQHFQNSERYEDYHKSLTTGPDLWADTAQKYEDSHQLVALGLISEGE